MRAIHKHFSKPGVWAILILAALHIAAIHSAYGVDGDPIAGSDQTLDRVIKKIANLVFKVGTPVVIFFIVLTGLMFVLAQGNEQKLKSARTMFYGTLIGIVIVFGAPKIAELIIDFVHSLIE